MATPETNEKCYYVQHDPHKCKIELEKFHFDIDFHFEISMECFDVCLTMPISKITSGLNAEDVFYYTHCFKHVLRKKMCSYCLT